MNCINAGGINDCYWNIDAKCTSFDCTHNLKTSLFSRDWDTKQNCTLTQIGVHLCGAYISQGKEELRQSKDGERMFTIGDSVQFTDKLLGTYFGTITKIRNNDYQIEVHVRDNLYRKWSIKKDDTTLRKNKAGEP